MSVKLSATPVVTVADITRVLSYWNTTSNASVYLIVPEFLRDVANGFRPATADAVLLAKTHWESTLADISSLIIGS